MRRVGRERQLHLKVRALCGEVEKVFDVLVDTGAHVSLVKAGLLPPECLTDSRKPVRLKVANGQYMVGGTKEAAIGLQFVNHRELSRPDLDKEILLQGRFYEAEMDWDMIVGYNFMMETDSGVLPAQASMTLYQDDQLSGLSSPEHHVECQWIRPERNQLEVAALGTEPTGPANQEYGVMPEVASRVVADLGASDLALDAFSSGTSAHLRVCEKYWSAQDSAWKKHWGPHQGLMWIHCPRWDIPRAVAKICKDRSKAVLVVPMGCTEEESTRDWVVSLSNMTLNKVVLPAGESVYQDAKGQPMPPQRWPTVGGQSGEGERLTSDAPRNNSQVRGNRDRTAPPQARQTEQGTGAGHAEGHGQRGTALPAPSAGTVQGAHATPPSGGESGRCGSASAHTRKGHAGTTRRATGPSTRKA